MNLHRWDEKLIGFTDPTSCDSCGRPCNKRAARGGPMTHQATTPARNGLQWQSSCNKRLPVLMKSLHTLAYHGSLEVQIFLQLSCFCDGMIQVYANFRWMYAGLGINQKCSILVPILIPSLRYRYLNVTFFDTNFIISILTKRKLHNTLQYKSGVLLFSFGIFLLQAFF